MAVLIAQQIQILETSKYGGGSAGNMEYKLPATGKCV